MNTRIRFFLNACLSSAALAAASGTAESAVPHSGAPAPGAAVNSRATSRVQQQLENLYAREGQRAPVMLLSENQPARQPAPAFLSVDAHAVPIRQVADSAPSGLAQAGGSSAVQRQLEMLYQKDGREMPPMTLSEVPVPEYSPSQAIPTPQAGYPVEQREPSLVERLFPFTRKKTHAPTTMPAAPTAPAMAFPGGRMGAPSQGYVPPVVPQQTAVAQPQAVPAVQTPYPPPQQPAYLPQAVTPQSPYQQPYAPPQQPYAQPRVVPQPQYAAQPQVGSPAQASPYAQPAMPIQTQTATPQYPGAHPVQNRPAPAPAVAPVAPQPAVAAPMAVPQGEVVPAPAPVIPSRRVQTRFAAEPGVRSQPTTPARGINEPQVDETDSVDATAENDFDDIPRLDPVPPAEMKGPKGKSPFEGDTFIGSEEDAEESLDLDAFPADNAPGTPAANAPAAPMPETPKAQQPEAPSVSDESPFSGLKLDTPAEPEAPKSAPAPRTPEPRVTVEVDEKEKQREKLRQLASAPESVGFKGFCPVLLKDHRELKRVRPEFSSEYHSQRYEFSSAEAKARFDKDPERYVPAGDGFDTVLLVDEDQRQPGSLDHAAWFQGRLYLFASAENLTQFMTDPADYANELQRLAEVFGPPEVSEPGSLPPLEASESAAIPMPAEKEEKEEEVPTLKPADDLPELSSPDDLPTLRSEDELDMELEFRPLGDEPPAAKTSAPAAEPKPASKSSEVVPTARTTTGKRSTRTATRPQTSNVKSQPTK